MRANPAIVSTLCERGIVEHLVEHGYALLPSSLPKLLPEIMPGFHRLITDAAELERWRVNDFREIDLEDGKSDLGLRMDVKGEKKPNPRPDEVAEGRTHYDASKHTLHYSLRLAEYLRRQGADLASYRSMLDALSIVHDESTMIGYAVAELLDRKYPEYCFAHRMHEAAANTKTRALIYPYDADDGSCAKAMYHRDKAFLTVHVQSNFPGLDLLTPEGDHIDADETDPEHVILFWGIKAEGITQGGLPAMPHGVVERRTSRKPYAGPERRKAQLPRETLVAFVHAYWSTEEEAWYEKNVQPIRRKSIR